MDHEMTGDDDRHDLPLEPDVGQATDVESDDPEMAAYYRDLAEVNETITNLYRWPPAPTG